MEPVGPEVERIFAAKKERRRRLAALPFEEKVRIVVQMQRMIAPILQARGVPVRVWEIGEPDTSAGARTTGG